jgi:aminomethyltransferase
MTDAESATTLRRTPLHSRHVDAGATLVDFGGWEMPLEYSGTVSEHAAVRDKVGIFDVSHMGYTEISGPGTVEWLNGILSNDIDRITAGQAQYTLLCNQSGGVIDDLIVYRVADDGVFIVPNAANSDAVVAALTSANDGTPITVSDLREDYGIIAVQGPDSSGVLSAIGLSPTISQIDYMAFERTTWQGHPIVVARSGYTGERGFELIIPNEALGPLWDALVSVGATRCGLGARDTLRTEMGYPLHGQDISANISPVQARLGWAVGWDKADFHGAGALRTEREHGPDRTLRGLMANERGVLRPGMSVRDHSGTAIGVTTSGTFSPTLKRGIALALLAPGVEEGDEVVVDVRGRDLQCTVTKPPFVPSHVR